MSSFSVLDLGGSVLNAAYYVGSEIMERYPTGSALTCAILGTELLCSGIYDSGRNSPIFTVGKISLGTTLLGLSCMTDCSWKDRFMGLMIGMVISAAYEARKKTELDYRAEMRLREDSDFRNRLIEDCIKSLQGS